MAELCPHHSKIWHPHLIQHEEPINSPILHREGEIKTIHSYAVLLRLGIDKAHAVSLVLIVSSHRCLGEPWCSGISELEVTPLFRKFSYLVSLRGIPVHLLPSSSPAVPHRSSSCLKPVNKSWPNCHFFEYFFPWVILSSIILSPASQSQSWENGKEGKVKSTAQL